MTTEEKEKKVEKQIIIVTRKNTTTITSVAKEQLLSELSLGSLVCNKSSLSRFLAKPACIPDNSTKKKDNFLSSVKSPENVSQGNLFYFSPTVVCFLCSYCPKKRLFNPIFKQRTHTHTHCL